jgi:hypothetical protein
VRLALNNIMQNDGDFVDVILLYRRLHIAIFHIVISGLQAVLS